MSARTPPEDEARARNLGARIRRSLPPPLAEAGPCPDENVLAAFAEDRLPGRTRETVERHLARCDPCRGVCRELVRDAAGAPGLIVRRGFRRFTLAVAAAAALLVSTVTLLRLLDRPSGTEEALWASTRNAARARADLFPSGVIPFTEAERLAGGSGVSRSGGDPVPIHPAGRILETRPAFRWESAGDGTATVTLADAAGRRLWQRSTPSSGGRATLAYPPDEPALAIGAGYAWEVEVRGDLGTGASGPRVFEVSPRAWFDERAAAIEAASDPAVRLLVRAHWALRERFLAEAEAAARSFHEAHPDDVVGRETLLLVLRRTGSSDAEAIARTLAPPR